MAAPKGHPPYRGSENGGRPQKNIDWNLVERMIESQCNAKEIMGGIGVSQNTFYERFKEHFGKSFCEYCAEKAPYGLGLIRLAQMQKTLNNNSKGNAQLLMWMGKVLLGQTEAVAVKEDKGQNDALVDVENKNMILEAKIAKIQEELDSIRNKCKTE